MSSKKVFQTTSTEEIMNTVETKKPVIKISPSQLNIASYPIYKVSSPIKKYLPYSLNLNSKFNYKIFEKLVLISLLSIFVNNASEASTRKPTSFSSKNNVSQKAKIASLRRTEASTSACVGDCDSQQPQRKVQSALSEYICNLPATQRGDFKCEDAAYFDDGNDKQAVVDLRIRRANGETLSIEENAILQGASRTGQISFCKGVSSNGILVRVDGRDAIVTTAHAVLNQETGQLLCEDLSKVGFFPNVSFYDQRNGNPNDFEKRKIALDGKNPLNLENVVGKSGLIPYGSDFLVFFLDKKEKPISQDRLPDGSVRGYMKFSSNRNKTGTNLIMIGLDPQFKLGENLRGAMTTAYQTCKYQSNGELTLSHNCDSIKGTSSSLLANLENNELTFRAVHTDGSEKTFDLNQSEDVGLWNTGNPSSNIIEYLNQNNLMN